VKKKEKQAFQEKTSAQLQKEADKAEKTLTKLRLELRAGKLKNVRQLMNQRHHLAMIKTIIKEKTLTQ